MKYKKPLIAIYLPSLRGGGAERVMVTLAKGFVQKGLDVDLVLARAEGPYLADVPQQVRVVDLGKARVLASLWPLMKYLRREKPRAMLSTMGHANIIALLARLLTLGVPRVVVREANSIKTSIRNSTLLRGKATPILVKLLYPFADAIIANSTGALTELADVLGDTSQGKLHLIYNPVDLEDIQRKAEGEIEYGIFDWLGNKQCPLVLGMGRLAASKDFQTLIRSFAGVRKKMAVKLLIIGEGDQRQDLEKLVRELDLEADVRLPGFVQNPYPLLKRASVFVLSSRWEGLPNALLEALAVGTPVVATDCPSGPAEILENGKYGKLVPVGDVVALSEAIYIVLDKKEHVDLSRCLANYSLEEIVGEFLLLFGEKK